ncbi:GNAT family N-acetyltransferase [Streptomyces mangrovisoli]|uniref:GNAT family N-acetyltransferase n=1 Tax=Streptomyces mangrovisoli TaxID=1428628 RepID=A0A1J4NPQ8_9ACTN|nr:GNAT family N-acetyltransferase [Streptomyces mangrovisoli]OIJ64351.1 GNAT family N-acetyltransferase [Streptomyces mangrovisoli]
MLVDDWRLTGDLDDFHARAGEFLRSRPALHNMPLTEIERRRTRGAEGAEAALFGRLESGDGITAVFYRRTRGSLWITPLGDGQADTLAARLAGLGHSPSGVFADHDTATAFARAWQRHTGAAPAPTWRTHLYRLGTLTPPRPYPEGRGRVAGASDHDHVVRWCREFSVVVGEQPSIDLIDAGRWADSRFGDRQFTFWESADGTPLSMAAATSVVGGMVRVDPVYTPARLRGRGYAGAATAEVSRAALAAGAREVVLHTDPANPTSNALYQRIGYVRLADFTGYSFSYGAPREAG